MFEKHKSTESKDEKSYLDILKKIRLSLNPCSCDLRWMSLSLGSQDKIILDLESTINLMTGILIRKGTERFETHRREGNVKTDTEFGATTNQGMLRISGNHQKLEEMQGIDIASGFPEGTNPDNTLILEFLASRTVREYFCYEGPRKLIQTIMDT